MGSARYVTGELTGFVAVDRRLHRRFGSDARISAPPLLSDFMWMRNKALDAIMNRVPTTDSLPGGSTQSAPLIEESIFESEDADDWGNFVDSDEEPDVEFACKDINLYPKGFCYPISISDIIVERYRIIHKLGHGAFSTV
ncbi:hypothetical protein BKA60DRAFT_666085 [Fusarium oxysporum]|nr:hypothetical protein BKA60DRAFT_666085 [Fusarium oxysporum]